jgi:hypothetical protein
MKHSRFTTEKYQLRVFPGGEILKGVMWLLFSAFSLALAHSSVSVDEEHKNLLPGSDIEQALKDVTPLSLGVAPLRPAFAHPDEESLSGVNDALPPLDFPEAAAPKRSSRRSVPAPR